MTTVSAPGFWHNLYESRQDGWEMNSAHPSLVELLATSPPPRGRVAVPGCGRGHDARLLAAAGHDVVGYDFAAPAVTAARVLAREAGSPARFAQQDVFGLGTLEPGRFDGVWEYTCFCAIDPGRRPEYVRTLATILRPGGWLWAVFFPMRPRGGGPPFGVARGEVRKLLAPAFTIERAGPPPRPVPRRLGLEWLVMARRIR